MNIFLLNECPVISAQEQCDKHVVKMIVESAQMLSTAHRLIDGEATKVLSKNGRRMTTYKLKDMYMDSILYKSVHTGHPSTLWTIESLDNYVWHYNHFVALCDEYEYRYGKVHATRLLLEKPLRNTPKNIPDIGPTPFKLAMGSNPECMVADPVEAYQLYYQTKQDRFKMVWSKRDVPSWFKVQEVDAA